VDIHIWCFVVYIWCLAISMSTAVYGIPILTKSHPVSSAGAIFFPAAAETASSVFVVG